MNLLSLLVKLFKGESYMFHDYWKAQFAVVWGSGKS